MEVASDPTLLFLLAQPAPISFSFDYVAGEASTQEEMFARVGRPLAQAVISGYNATCFAYGQTGSGAVLALAKLRVDRLSALMRVHVRENSHHVRQAWKRFPPPWIFDRP